ncbi:MAG: P-loop NTPase [Firmicutes bacterium]|nr:P-loop NTPase [Alicyclobacillaceae bacterium]MCL6497839.1 P-loop NTPase [Bacillota bacterium]
MRLQMALALSADLLPAVVRWAAQSTDLAVTAASPDLRGALEGAGPPPDLVVVDDVVLRENPGWIGRLREQGLTVVVLGAEEAEAFRRALAAGAVDFIRRDAWAQELPAVVERIVAARRPEPRPLLAVFSPKGGVGKSTLAANLACAAGGRTGAKVALVDFDLQFGDLATLLGIEPRATVADAARLPSLTQDALSRLLQPVEKTAVSLLASPLNPLEAEEITAARAVEILDALRRAYEVVVVDTALGYTDVNVAALDVADLILVVLTPDVVTVRSVVRALDLFRDGFQYPPEKVRLVLNRDGTGLRRDEIAEALGRPIDFGLPSDGAWPVRAANQGTPLWLMNRQSQFVRATERIAEALFPRPQPARRPRALARRLPPLSLTGRG